MERKAKWDFNVSTIVGITFAFIGIVYLGISILLFTTPEDAEAVTVRQIFLPMGLCFLIAGIVLLVRAAAKKRQADQLMEEGYYVWGTIAELQQVRSVNSLNGHPCVVLVCYTDPRGAVHHFRSRYLHRAPSPSILGKQVRVYTKSGQYKPYYVDIDPVLPARKPIK